MSSQIPAVNFAGAVVNQTATVDLTQVVVVQPLTTSPAGWATLRLQNESGCGLQITFPSGAGFPLAAGQWLDTRVNPQDRTFTWTIVYILPNAPVTLLLGQYFVPGEPVPPLGPLGNSPIGLSGAVSAVTNQVINDGQAAVTTVLEANPSTGVNAGISSAKINNDGSGYLGGNKLTFDNAGDITGSVNINWGKQQTAYAELTSFTDANGAAAVMQSQAAGAATYIQFVTWNGSATTSPLGLGSQALVGSYEGTIIGDGGTLIKVGGQASAGTFGVPVIVAQAKDVNVTVTTLQTILTFTPPATGLYRLNAFFTHQNPSSPTNCTLSYTWTDPHTGSRPSGDFIIANSASYIIVNGAGIGNNASILTVPVTVWASSTASIVIAFQDASGTPNDFVTALIERLA